VKKSSQQMGPSIVASTPLKHTKLSISQNIAELSSKRVFMDFKIGNHVPVRVNMYLYDKVVPKTAENFRQLCTGEAGHKYKELK